MFSVDFSCMSMCVGVHSHVQLFVTAWTISSPGCSVHGIFQARILEWVAVSSSKGSSWPRDQTHVSHVSCIGRQLLYHCTIWLLFYRGSFFLVCWVFLSWRGVTFCKHFLHQLRWSCGLSLFILLMQWTSLIDFCILKHPCIPEINLIWLWCMILLMCYWVEFSSTLLKIFMSIFIRGIGLNFPYSIFL